jgi:hypothetical protein
VQTVVQHAAKRIVRFLQKRDLIAFASTPGDGEVAVVVGDETLGDDDPLLAQLLAAATAGAPPAGSRTRLSLRLVSIAPPENWRPPALFTQQTLH